MGMEGMDGVTSAVGTVGELFATTNGRKVLIVSALVLILISVIAGSLVPRMGPLGGLAMGGFNALLILPIAIASVLGSALVLGGIGAAVSFIGDGDVGNAFGKGAIVGAVIGLVLSIFALLAASRAICGNFSRFSGLTYGDALAFAGHSIWVSISLGLIAGCALTRGRR